MRIRDTEVLQKVAESQPEFAAGRRQLPPCVPRPTQEAVTGACPLGQCGGMRSLPYPLHLTRSLALSQTLWCQNPFILEMPGDAQLGCIVTALLVIAAA